MEFYKIDPKQVKTGENDNLASEKTANGFVQFLLGGLGKKVKIQSTFC
jgi:hypothetical protein